MRLSQLSRRAALAPVLAACALGAAAGAANAEIVVYTDASNDVWAENVDGTFRRQITTDGDSQFPYSFPSMNDAGDVAAIKRNRLNSDDTQIVFQPASGGTPTVNLMPSWGSGVLSPLGARLQPEGKLLAYSFVKGDLWSNTQAGNVVPADAPGSPVGGPGFPGMLSATWNGGKLVWSDGTSLAYGNGNESSSWISDGSRSFAFGEVSRDGTRLLARTRISSTYQIAYQAMRGPMPSTVDETVGGCYVPFTGELGHIALSPSGQYVAFRDGAGLHVAKIALPPGEESICLLQDRVVSPTGDASFSAHTYVDPNQRQPDERQPDQRQPDQRQPDDRRPGDDGRRPSGRRGRVAVASRSLGAALSKGLTVKLSGLPKGRLTVRAKQGRKVVATGRANVAASGRATVKLRFTAAARRALKRKRSVTLTIVAGKASAKVTLKR